MALLDYQEHSRQISNLRGELDRKTDQRYRQADAERDFKLVEYRFSRNEENIQSCMDFIKAHRDSE